MKEKIANNCFGGVGRMAQYIKSTRENDPLTLLLNAGDFYQGEQLLKLKNYLEKYIQNIVTISKAFRKYTWTRKLHKPSNFKVNFYFKGTMWYTIFKYHPVVEFSNLLNYSTGSVGNHDWDDALEVWSKKNYKTNHYSHIINLHK